MMVYLWKCSKLIYMHLTNKTRSIQIHTLLHNRTVYSFQFCTLFVYVYIPKNENDEEYKYIRKKKLNFPWQTWAWTQLYFIVQQELYVIRKIFFSIHKYIVLYTVHHDNLSWTRRMNPETVFSNSKIFSLYQTLYHFLKFPDSYTILFRIQYTPKFSHYNQCIYTNRVQQQQQPKKSFFTKRLRNIHRRRIVYNILPSFTHWFIIHDGYNVYHASVFSNRTNSVSVRSVYK